MIIRLTICLLFSCQLMFGNSLESIYSNPSTNAGLVVNCPPTDTIFVTCIPQIPSDGTMDLAYFQGLGGSITSSCNTVVIRAEDSPGNTPVTNCSESRVFTRTITIHDGPPGGLTEFTTCTVIYKAEVPYYLQRTGSFPSEIEVSCDEDVPTIFQSWLDNYGGQMFGSCTPITLVSTEAAIPNIDYGISGANPDGCGDATERGNGYTSVKFNVIDSCGHTSNTIAAFRVVDNVGPSILCPDDITLDITDPDLEDKIKALAGTADDNCSLNVDAVNTFLDDDIDSRSCDPQQEIAVLFVAEDDCGNTNDCTTMVTVLNDRELIFTCPTDTLILECGSPTIQGDFQNWVAGEFRATNLIGENVSAQITNNFDPAELLPGVIHCNTARDILFTVTDPVCNQTESCNAFIQILDTAPPTVDLCPSDLSVSTTNPNMRQDVLDWLATFAASDVCNTPTLSDNLDRTILDGNCAASALEVIFLANDQCNPVDSTACVSSLTIQNDIVSDFVNFPSDTTFICSSNPSQAALDDWIRTASAANNLASPQTFTVQADINFNDPVFNSCDTTVMVTFFFSDQCGIRVEYEASLTVIDNVIPEITCPSDMTFNGIFSDIESDIQAWLQTPVISDNCGFGAGSLTTSYFPQLFGGCEDTIPASITFAVRDACGNVSTPCMSELTVITDKQPSISCPNDLILDCGDTNNQDLIDLWLMDIAGTDFLGDSIPVSNNYNANGLDFITCLDSLQVDFGVQDACGFSDECTRYIVVQDVLPPNLTCPPTIAINSTAPDNSQVIEDWINTVQFDDNGCAPPSMTTDYIATAIDFCAPTAAFIDITFSVEDVCGLRAQPCVGRVNFNLAAPDINCPNTTLDLECGDPNNPALINTWLLSTSSTDNSSIDVPVINNFQATDIDTSCTQFLDIEFMSIDVCGAESTCTGRININDTQAPVYTAGCPMPLSLSSGTAIDIKEQIFSDYIASIFVTDCNEFTLTNDFDVSRFTVDCDDNTFPITFTLEDECNNRATPCMTEIQITNSINPVIICPASSLTIECGADGNDQIITDWLATASADDGMSSTAVADNFEFDNPDLTSCGSMISVEFLMSNFCGMDQTCNQTIIVEDTTAPEFTFCPTDTTFLLEDVDFDLQVNNWTSTALAIDNCITALSYSDNTASDVLTVTSLPQCTPSLPISITFTAMDGCGQSVDCSSILTIISERSPMINCPGALEIECGDSNNADLIDDWIDSATAMDEDGNALNPSTDYNPASLDAIDCDGIITVIFAAIDNCGNNLECSNEIIVTDTTIPTAICPIDITVNSTDPAAATTANDWLNSNSAIDNCSMATASSMTGFSIPNDLCLQDEITSVEFYATDFCGMRDTCVAILTVNKEAPSISCPDNLQLQCGELANEEIINDWLDQFSGTDNNGEPLSVDDDFSMMTLPNDCNSTPIVFNFSVTDVCNEPTTCEVSITQRDTLAPIITFCPSDVEFDISALDLNTSVSTWLGSFTAMDQCNNAMTSNSYDILIEDFDCGIDTMVVFTAVDDCNNIDETCISNIKISNNLVIEITCPSPIEVKCNDAPSASQIPGFLNSFSVEADDPIFTVSNDLIFNDLDLECSGTYDQEITFTATDQCGNIGECTTFISFIPAAALYIPTIFNPAEGGVNSRFTIRANEVNGESLIIVTTFKIYSRWGGLMYDRENFNPNADDGWDGRDDQGRIVQGVYTYLINYVDTFGNEFEEIGTLTLVK